MARQSSSTAKPKASSATKSKGKAASPAEKRAKQAKGARPQATEEPRLLDERTRRDITGVAFAVLAVVLFVAAVLPTNAVVTSFVSTALHLSLGLGAYLLPFLLLIIGASFLARFDRERVPVRVAVGLVMIFVAALSLLALFTPESAPDSVDRLFLSDELAARGGYLGAGIAWVGISLFGQAVTCIIMIGIVLAGLVIIGFSVSKLVERVQDARRALVADDADDDVLAAPPYARMKRSTGAKVPVVPTTGEVVEAGATNVLPRAKDAKGRPSKPRRASQSLVTQAIGNRAASTEEGGGEAPQTLTRKLGRKHDKSDSSPAAPKPSASSTPLASPRPADGFVLPPADLLAVSKNSKKDRASDAELADTAACLQETLESFAIMAEVVGWVAGPTVTLFKVDLPAGVRVSRITALEQDIALALAAPGVRIFAPIPGTNYVGIEVPNRTRQSVLLGDVIKDADEGPLQIVIGKDVEGRSIVSDLAKMPHLLIGGTTGSGKSVSINAMIMSILMRATPSEVRFIMIDPKRVEFTPYNGIPHLYVPVVTEPREAASALSWGVAEMERRLKVFSKVGARNIGQYNAKVQAELAAQQKAIEAGEEPPAGELHEPHLVQRGQRHRQPRHLGHAGRREPHRPGRSLAVEARVRPSPANPGMLRIGRRDQRRGGHAQRPGRAGVPFRDPADEPHHAGRVATRRFGRRRLRRRSAHLGSGGHRGVERPRINLEHPAPPEGGLFARWAYNGHAGGKGRRGAAERQQAPRSARRRHGARDVEGLRGARRGEP